jgi:gas vesicle protein
MRGHDYEDEPYVVIEQRSGDAGSFFWGLAIGAAVALLFAPSSGEETRQQIRRRAKRVGRAAQDAAEDISDKVVDRYENARQAVEERIDTARRAIELKKAQAQEAIRAGREAAHMARSDLERRIEETKAAYEAGADVAREGRTSSTLAGGEDEE